MSAFISSRRIGGPGRVRGRVEDDPLGLRGQDPVELLGLELEAVRHVGVGEDRRAAAQPDHLRVGHPVGAGDHHLVAGVQGGEEGVVEHLLAAGAHDGLRDLVVEPVLALELAHDRLAQGHDAGDRRVAGLVPVDRLDRRLLDVLGRVEIRLAHRQADDVDARRLQVPGLLGHHDGRGRLHPREDVGEESHGVRCSGFSGDEVRRRTCCGAADPRPGTLSRQGGARHGTLGVSRPARRAGLSCARRSSLCGIVDTRS